MKSPLGCCSSFGTNSVGSLPPAWHKNRKLNLLSNFNTLKQLLKGRASVKLKIKQEKSETWQKRNLKDGAGRISNTEDQIGRQISDIKKTGRGMNEYIKGRRKNTTRKINSRHIAEKKRESRLGEIKAHDKIKEQTWTDSIESGIFFPSCSHKGAWLANWSVCVFTPVTS